MYIPANLLPSAPFLAAYFAWIPLLGYALLRSPWRALHANRLHHLYFGAVVALLVLWTLDAGLRPGLGFHFLGVTVFTLMFGWSLAVVGVGLAALGIALSGAGLEAWALNALLSGVLPVTVSYGVYHWVHRHLPHHLFIYIFLCAFAGAIAAAIAAVFALVGVLVVADIYPYGRIAEEYLPFLPLYLFPEGLLNGMLTTVLVGLRPQWLKTFDDRYLRS